MNSKSPLKSLQRHASILAVGYFFVAQAASVALGADMILKGEGDISLFSFDHEMGSNVAQKARRVSTTNAPSECGTQGQSAPATFEHAATVQEFQPVEWATINHSDLDADSVRRSHGTSVSEGLVNCDAALSVKQASEVGVDVFIHTASEQKVRELGEHPMPGLIETGAEGQSRTKQEGFGFPGVRREQVRTPKGKVCSELGGNVENEMETVSSCVAITIPHRVTESYQKTCNVPVRFVRPGGQGTSADTTWESLEYMGRPWYWDRQCPTGRAYFLRNDDTYFMVDPRFVFKWTGDLTYPDQMAFTRLCGLRFFLKTDRRMFQAVVDGVTA